MVIVDLRRRFGLSHGLVEEEEIRRQYVWNKLYMLTFCLVRVLNKLVLYRYTTRINMCMYSDND